MNPSRIGRNEPCPCGSGKKYKKCCLDQAPLATPIPAELSPAELVQRRGEAFARADFGFIYDTYHPDSNFRAQFPERADYIATGKSSLAQDFFIDECRVLKEEVGSAEARVLFYLETRYRGQKEAVFELSQFLLTAEGWRYLASQKLARSAFGGEIEEVDWGDFEEVKNKLFF